MLAAGYESTYGLVSFIQTLKKILLQKSSTLPATVPLSPTSPSPPPALPTASSFQPDQLPHQPRASSAHLPKSLLRRGGGAEIQSTVLAPSGPLEFLCQGLVSEGGTPQSCPAPCWRSSDILPQFKRREAELLYFLASLACKKSCCQMIQF